MYKSVNAALLAITMSLPAMPAMAADADACSAAKDCRRVQLWSNYAALYSSDGQYLTANTSYQCSGNGTPELLIYATQNDVTGFFDNMGKVLKCDGTLQMMDLSLPVDDMTKHFDASKPVSLQFRLTNGINDVRIDTAQTVQDVDGKQGVRAGIDWGLGDVVKGSADPRLVKDNLLTAKLFYQCTQGAPADGVLRAIQGDAAASTTYRLTCDGTSRVLQVSVNAFPTLWQAGDSSAPEVQLFSQLDGGDASAKPSMWQRLTGVSPASQAALPLFNHELRQFSESLCTQWSQDSGVTLAKCDPKAHRSWSALADGTIQYVDGRCLDGSGSNVDLKACDSSDAQKWQLNPRSEEDSISTGGKCLAAEGDKPAVGAKLLLATCDKSDAQSFWFVY